MFNLDTETELEQLDHAINALMGAQEILMRSEMDLRKRKNALMECRLRWIIMPAHGEHSPQ